MKLANRMNRLGTENAFVVLAEVNRLLSQGKDIVSFCIGEPDFDTPENIKKAAIKAIRDGYTHYGPSAGLPELRQEIADYISRTRMIDIKPGEVVITPGGKPIIYHSLHALIEEGDEVIYPNPGFPIYESVINFVGAKPVPAPLLEKKGFSIDTEHLKNIVKKNTKMIIINSPQNPTGGILSESDLEEIASIAKENDLWVLSDEIYSRIIYDGRFRSISSIDGMKERTIILEGFSKTYAMTGWRIGYGVMPAYLAEKVAQLETNCESCTATFTQMAALEAYRGPQNDTEKMVEEFRARRDLVVDGLNDIKGISCLRPGGSFYVFPNVTKVCRNMGFGSSKEFQEYLLYNYGVAVLPRTSFGVKNEGEDQEYIRLSYATSRENIMIGLKKIRDAVKRGR
ncbi:MAG: pyridoxal phosphate-dependent aminotransferase [Actinobacteria bacterium]|nr:pyridoxal phosphate-dependent aminotransferase [Actinomycetota bacterium]